MNPILKNIRERFARVLFFFPFQLLLVYVKKNHVLLFFWFLAFGYVSGIIGKPYGIPYLFVDPEYLGEVSFWSHLIIGFACGGFIMAFNISSYIINGFRFPFIATLSRPFFKFCLNNCILPLLFIGVYLYKLITFQVASELETPFQVALNVLGFVTGNASFILFAFGYFFQTNVDAKRIRLRRKKQPDTTAQAPDKKPKGQKEASMPVQGILHKREKWYKIFNRDREWRIETYLANWNKIALARGSEHYRKETLQSVFAQNHINASLFEILVILSIIALGAFRELPFARIPAGASVLLVFTMFMMLTSALHSWLKGWSTAALLLGFALVNHMSQYEQFNYTNRPYGMQYEGNLPAYTNEHIATYSNNTELHREDHLHNVEVLNNWRLKNATNTLQRKQKPKLVLVNTTGGGLRSAMWTFRTLTFVDSLLEGELLNHTQLITGSSGGMVGASYLRELYLRQQQDGSCNIYADSLQSHLGRDILNPVIFTIATNDLFVRLQSFTDNGISYTKDRGYTFENILNQNTNQLMNKRLGDYYLPEASAQIPTMIFAPTLSNDGRRLLISSQPVSYLTSKALVNGANGETLPDGIEFRRFFSELQPDSTRFSSVLRMNATFPYILPNATLPTNPPVDVLDAGVRDNFGLLVSLKYLFEFRDWISSNTSGIVFLQIRDKERKFEVMERGNTVLRDLTSPLGAFGNWENIQKFNQDELMQYASAWFDGPIDVVDFELHQDPDEKISLSWHLTKQEQQYILGAIHAEHNKASVESLRTLLE